MSEFATKDGKQFIRESPESPWVERSSGRAEAFATGVAEAAKDNLLMPALPIDILSGLLQGTGITDKPLEGGAAPVSYTHLTLPTILLV